MLRHLVEDISKEIQVTDFSDPVHALLWSQKQPPDLVILDATCFAEPPVGSIRIPHRVPPGFHGNWVANG